MTAFGHTHNDGVVRLRNAGRSPGSTGQFSVPATMARAVPENARFRAEWHDDGILYRFLGVAESDPNAFGEPAAWAKNGGSA